MCYASEGLSTRCVWPTSAFWWCRAATKRGALPPEGESLLPLYPDNVAPGESRRPANVLPPSPLVLLTLLHSGWHAQPPGRRSLCSSAWRSSHRWMVPIGAAYYRLSHQSQE